MKPPAISAWPPPRSAICSGTSTSTAPNITEGIATKAVASTIGRLQDRLDHLAQVLAFGRLGLRQAGGKRASANATRSTALKTFSVPTVAASAPSAGPNRAPATAVPSAVPITEPRFSGGAALTSQVSAPDQISAPAAPWAKRAASSSRNVWAKPKATLATPSSSRPQITVRRGPEAGSHQSRRQREEEGAGGVGGGEHACLRLAQAQIGDVIGQQRRNCREKDDVKEDHRRSKYEQSTHCRQYNHLERSQSWAVASSIDGSPYSPEGWQSG